MAKYERGVGDVAGKSCIQLMEGASAAIALDVTSNAMRHDIVDAKENSQLLWLRRLERLAVPRGGEIGGR